MPKYVTQFCEVPGARLSYIESGTGQPLIFIHGNSSDKHFFNGYVRTFSDRFHCYALDSRCHGETSCPHDDVSFARIADDIIVFCEKQQLKDPRVVGFSDGGIVALLLAHKAPTVFPLLISISPNYLASGLKPGGYRSMIRYRGIILALQRLGLSLKRARARVDLVLSDSGLTEADLQQIQTAVRLVSAEHDMIAQDHLQQIASLVPGILWHIIPHSTHMTIMFKRDTRQLLGRLLAAPPLER